MDYKKELNEFIENESNNINSFITDAEQWKTNIHKQLECLNKYGFVIRDSVLQGYNEYRIEIKNNKSYHREIELIFKRNDKSGNLLNWQNGLYVYYTTNDHFIYKEHIDRIEESDFIDYLFKKFEINIKNI